MFAVKLMKREDQPLCKWTGGQTRSFFIYPPGGEGATAFDYDFEITSSTMEFPDSEYTIYEGYDRILMIIENSVKLVHEDGRTVVLNKYDYDVFSGETATHSYGLATDYEMMVRHGIDAGIKVIELPDAGEQITPKKAGFNFVYSGIYCEGKECSVEAGGEVFYLRHADHLSFVSDETIRFQIKSGEGKAINSFAFFN